MVIVRLIGQYREKALNLRLKEAIFLPAPWQGLIISKRAEINNDVNNRVIMRFTFGNSGHQTICVCHPPAKTEGNTSCSAN